MRHRNYREKKKLKKTKEGKEGVLFADVCVWWLAGLAKVPCVILVVHHIAALAESK